MEKSQKQQEDMLTKINEKLDKKISTTKNTIQSLVKEILQKVLQRYFLVSSRKCWKRSSWAKLKSKMLSRYKYKH